MADRFEPAVEALPERWAHQWNRTLEWMGLGMVFIPVGERLWDCYSKAGRFHHDPRHALACVRALDDYPGVIPNQDELELALWFHDAAYCVNNNCCGFHLFFREKSSLYPISWWCNNIFIRWINFIF